MLKKSPSIREESVIESRAYLSFCRLESNELSMDKYTSFGMVTSTWHLVSGSLMILEGEIDKVPCARNDCLKLQRMGLS